MAEKSKKKNKSTNAGKTMNSQVQENFEDNKVPTEDAESVEAQEAETQEDSATEESCEEAVNNAEESAENEKVKKKKADPKQEKIDELEDKVKRQLAEFDNYRKRTDKEKSQMFETGAKSVIEKILPVVDNFERGLGAINEDGQITPFEEGMTMIYKQLMTELEKLEVKPIEAVGCEFDPNFHNAVMQVESEEFESGIVAQELQKGYTYRDTVVRHSMVAVVN